MAIRGGDVVEGRPDCLKKNHYGHWPNGISRQIEAALWNRNIQSDLIHTAVSAALATIRLLEEFAARIFKTRSEPKRSGANYTGALDAACAIGKDIEELPRSKIQTGI